MIFFWGVHKMDVRADLHPRWSRKYTQTLQEWALNGCVSRAFWNASVLGVASWSPPCSHQALPWMKSTKIARCSIKPLVIQVFFQFSRVVSSDELAKCASLPRVHPVASDFFKSWEEVGSSSNQKFSGEMIFWGRGILLMILMFLAFGRVFVWVKPHFSLQTWKIQLYIGMLPHPVIGIRYYKCNEPGGDGDQLVELSGNFEDFKAHFKRCWENTNLKAVNSTRSDQQRSF